MQSVGLLVKHRAKSGMRSELQATWDRFIRPAVEANPDHLLYYFCFDQVDPDVVCAFQIFKDEAALERFLAQPWYPDYIKAVSAYIEEPPVISRLSPQWSKALRV